MVDYPYPGTLVADPVTFRRAASAAVTVYAATDTNNATPLVLKDLSGLALANPLTSTADGFVPPFIAQVDGVKLVGGGLAVVVHSHVGLRAAADASAASAAAAANLVAAPADTAVETLIKAPASKTAVALSATYAPHWKTGTVYAIGAKVVSPNGDTVTANTAHTSAALFATDATKWDGAKSPLVFLAPPLPVVPTTEPVIAQWTANGTAGDTAPVSGGTIWASPAGYTNIQMHQQTPLQDWFSHGFAKTITINGYPLAANETVRALYQAQPWGLGFRTNATTIEITGSISERVMNRARPLIMIDGRPTTIEFPADTVAGNTQFAVLTLEFPEARQRTIEIIHPWMVGSIRHTSTATLTAWRRTTPKLYIQGDSWVAGTTQSAPLPSWAWSLIRDTPWNVATGGIGGTGYASGAATDTFNSAERRAAIVEYAPNFLVISGSINDNDKVTTTVTSAANAHWDALKVALPNLKIIVFGPQQVPGYEGQAEANRAALIAAAKASTKVDYVRDPIKEGWSAQSWVTGADPIHPSRMGAYLMAQIATSGVRLAADKLGDTRW